MPLMGVAASEVTINEGGKNVFNNGKFIVGVDGVTGAVVEGNEVVISVGGVRGRAERKAAGFRRRAKSGDPCSIDACLKPFLIP
jgi:hypothetical protein